MATKPGPLKKWPACREQAVGLASGNFWGTFGTHGIFGLAGFTGADNTRRTATVGRKDDSDIIHGGECNSALILPPFS
jgi:hypothetical protein